MKEVIRQVQKILLAPATKVLVSTIYGTELKLPVQSATEITTNLTCDTKGTNQLVGMGIGSSLTGKHFDRIFTDDIVNMKDRVSRAERERTKIVYQELQNIGARGGRIFNTGTPWHPDDAFTIMPEAEKYDCYHPDIRKIIDEKTLAKKRESMTATWFASNYELRFVASDDVIFTHPKTGEEAAKAENGIAHVDAAYGGEDYTALTICNKQDGIYHVYGRLWRKHVDDVIDEIAKEYGRFRCGKIYCEDNGDKGYLAKQLSAAGMRARTYHESTNKYVKIASILKGEWNNVSFVDGTDEEYINQVCDFCEDAAHDDAPDSLASAVRILLKKKDGDFVPLW